MVMPVTDAVLVNFALLESVPVQPEIIASSHARIVLAVD